MKYVKFVIMAVLIFGVAVSPVFSNGLAYAQSEKEQRSEESKQKKAEQTAKAEERTQTSKEERQVSTEKPNTSKEDKETPVEEVETSTENEEEVSVEEETSKEKHEEDSDRKQQKREDKLNRDTIQKEQKRQEQQEKRTISQEHQEQRKAELAERNRILMERLAEQERLDRERMQERLDRMDDRSPMNEAMEMLEEAGVLEPTVEPEIIEPELIVSPYVSIPRDNSVEIPLTKAGQYFSELENMISEQKRSQDMLFSKMNILLNLVNSMCEDKVIVVGVSDGMPRCVEYSTANKLYNRGMVTLFK